jgi:hypothetical protein
MMKEVIPLLGKAPQCLVFYNILNTKHMVDSVLSLGRYDTYEGTDRSYKFVLWNVDKSDSVIYYCATWTGTVIQTWLYLYRKYDLWQFLVYRVDRHPSHFLPQTSLNSEQRMNLRPTPKNYVMSYSYLNS